MSDDIIRLSAAELGERLAAGEISAVEATQAHLDRIAAVDGDVHAFLHVATGCRPRRGRATSTVAARRARSSAPLAGVPIAIKDVLVTNDMPTTSGSKILEGWVPPYDATVVRKVRDAGLVPLGKTNMDEFAMGSSHRALRLRPHPQPVGRSTASPAAPAVARPRPSPPSRRRSRSAATPAARIRQPAHVTGTVGVKPTYGGVSRYGAIALASSLDQIGPVSRTVLDSALLHDVIGGHDPRDSTSLRDRVAVVGRGRAQRRRRRACASASSSSSTARASSPASSTASTRRSRCSRGAGAEIVEVDAPNFEYAIAAYYLIMPAEASSNLAKFDSVRFGLRVTPAGRRHRRRRHGAPPARPASAPR